MSEPPPFPVPQGMEWDGVKKRFFKKPPEKAKIQEKKKKKRKEESKSKIDEQSVEDAEQNRILHHQGSHQPARRLLRSGISTAPAHLATHAAMMQRKKVVVTSVFSNLKHVSTTSLVPWRLQGHTSAASQCGQPWKNIKIRSLGSVENNPAILLFQAQGDLIYHLDTSHISKMGASSALAVGNTMDVGLSSMEDTHQVHSLEQAKSWTDQCLEWPQGDLSSQLKYDGQYYTYIPPRTVEIYLGRTSIPGITWIGDFEPHSAIKVLLFARPGKGGGEDSPDSIVLAYAASDRQLGLVAFSYVGKREHELDEMRAAYQTMDSDIICFEFGQDASSIFVGLRSGKIVLFDVEDFLLQIDKNHNQRRKGQSQAAFHPRYSENWPSRSPGLHVAAPVSGAVTHIVSLSSKEILVAYSEGTMQLRTSEKWHEPVRSFYGHVNSWSLDLPLTVDKEHRILALAGQDGKVRVWSLDESFPLRDTQGKGKNDACTFNLADHQRLCHARLDQITFSERVTGLAFCARRSVARASARSSDFDQTGTLPALAVACNGTEIGFFE